MLFCSVGFSIVEYSMWYKVYGIWRLIYITLHCIKQTLLSKRRTKSANQTYTIKQIKPDLNQTILIRGLMYPSGGKNELQCFKRAYWPCRELPSLSLVGFTLPARLAHPARILKGRCRASLFRATILELSKQWYRCRQTGGWLHCPQDDAEHPV